MNNLLQQGKDIKVDLQVTGQIFDRQYWERELAERVQPAVRNVVHSAMREWMTTEPDMSDPRVMAALGQRVARFSRFVNETTGERVQEIIREGYAQGLDVNQIAQNITSYFNEISPVRARLISRTETYGAFNYGTQAGLEQGQWERKMWITSRDDRVRESHQIDGQVVNIDEDFVLLDGTTMPYPMDFNERCIHIGTEEERNVGTQAPGQPEAPTREQVENDLATGSIRSIEELGGGVYESLLTSNDIRGVFKPSMGEEFCRDSIKPGTYYKREVAAYKFDKLFGFDLVPPTVIRRYGREVGSHQLYVSGTRCWEDSSPAEKATVSIFEKRRLAFYDWLVGNEDRHAGNLLIKEGKIYAIDNGLTFGKYVSFEVNQFFSEALLYANVAAREETKLLYQRIANYENLLVLKTELYDSGLLEKEAFGSLMARIGYLIEHRGFINTPAKSAGTYFLTVRNLKPKDVDKIMEEIKKLLEGV